MSDKAVPPGAPAPPRPTPPPPRSGGPGFFSRLVAAFLVVMMAAAVALLAMVGLLAYFGLTLDSPRQFDEGRAQLATAQVERAALQTAIVEHEARNSAARAELGELREQVGELVDLSSRMEQSSVENATVVAEARASRDAVAVYATAEAGRAALLDELQRRSDRLERFLQRLGDIASDAALDLQAGETPTPDATPAPAGTTVVPTLEATTAPEATPTRTADPAPSATPAR